MAGQEELGIWAPNRYQSSGPLEEGAPWAEQGPNWEPSCPI